MTESRTYRVSSQDDAGRIIDALAAAGLHATVEDDGEWRVVVEVEPQTMGDAQRVIREVDPDATDVTEAEQVNHATDL